MRWDDLFDDLAAQLDAGEAAALAGEVADRTRREQSLVLMRDRLAPARNHQVALTVQGAGQVQGSVTEVGVDWLLLEEAGRHELLVSTDQVLSIAGLSAVTDVQTGRVWGKLDFAWALRGLARNRIGVQVVLQDGSTWFGTIDRVGADHVELAEHPPGEERRHAQVRQVVLLPVRAISLVRNR